MELSSVYFALTGGMADLLRNLRPISNGMGGRFGPEYSVTVVEPEFTFLEVQVKG
jgi:hypothetical protein